MLEAAPRILKTEVEILRKQVAGSKVAELDQGENLISFFKKQMVEGIKRISLPGWKGWKWVSRIIGTGVTLVLEGTTGVMEQS